MRFLLNKIYKSDMCADYLEPVSLQKGWSR